MRKKTRVLFMLKHLFKKLEEYKTNRAKYPTIEDFYPELLKALAEFKTG